MRIITTFNDRLYQASGHELLRSINQFIPHAELLVYHELDEHQLNVPSVNIRSLPELADIRAKQLDVLAPEYGGSADQLAGFNRRWFGWFHKIVAQHDALVRRPSGGLTLFLDCDIRVINSFETSDIQKTFNRPVGVMKGTREATETGVIAFDERTPHAAEFVREVMELYLSGRFRDLPRWDDSYAYRHCAEASPALVHDIAAGKRAIDHTNSNGHTTSGQILPLTPWARYFEHDKGLHWRTGVATSVIDGSSESQTPKRGWKSILSRLLPRHV